MRVAQASDRHRFCPRQRRGRRRRLGEERQAGEAARARLAEAGIDASFIALRRT
jgi:hypothetical protein